jgi:AcrR family transcriptional regulator
MSPRPDVSEERRSQIVESAVKVFARKGFADTRMDDVAEAAGLSKGLLYWYFKSKDEILTALADLLFGDALRKIQSLPCEGLSAHACLMKYLEIFTADLRRLLKFMPVMYEFYALGFRSRTVRRVMRHYLRSLVTVLEPIIQQGMDNGEFAQGDARQTTLAMGAMLQGTLLMWAHDPNMVQVEAQLNLGAALVVRGLANKSGGNHA